MERAMEVLGKVKLVDRSHHKPNELSGGQAWFLSGLAGGADVVIRHAAQADKFNFWPQLNAREIFAFVGAAVTMMLGSIPQQDVFQRVMSAKN